jgi:hypothetical protein
MVNHVIEQLRREATAALAVNITSLEVKAQDLPDVAIT